MKKKDTYLGRFIIIIIIILIVSIAFPILIHRFLPTWQESGTFGDTFGALNAAFSGITVAGLIITILMQRRELEDQRQENEKTRSQFAVERITSIVYNQLERYEAAISQMRINDGSKTYTGYEAIFFLDRSKQIVFFSFDDQVSEEEQLKKRQEANCKAMKLYSKNDSSIAQFSLAAYNSAIVVKECLLKSGISLDEMNGLKNLFFRNIGFIQLNVLEDILEKYKEYLDFASSEDMIFLKGCDVEPGELGKAFIYLKSISEFRHTLLTAASIEETFKNWTNEFGVTV